MGYLTDMLHKTGTKANKISVHRASIGNSIPLPPISEFPSFPSCDSSEMKPIVAISQILSSSPRGYVPRNTVAVSQFPYYGLRSHGSSRCATGFMLSLCNYHHALAGFTWEESKRLTVQSGGICVAHNIGPFRAICNLRRQVDLRCDAECAVSSCR